MCIVMHVFRDFGVHVEIYVSLCRMMYVCGFYSNTCILDISIVLTRILKADVPTTTGDLNFDANCSEHGIMLMCLIRVGQVVSLLLELQGTYPVFDVIPQRL